MMNFLKSTIRYILPQKYILQIKYLRDLLTGLFYIGNKFICPVCGGNFRKFKEAGLIPRANEKCPRCSSMKRHRFLWLYLKNKTNFFDENLKVLHIAPEYCFYQRFSNQKNLDYLSADLRSPLAMVKMDITNILYEENFFDVILCSHVLEHIPDDRKAMRELWRVLKPGGWAILQVPIDINRQKTFEDPTIKSPEERRRFYGLEDHVRLYGLDYKDRLEQAGFTVKVDEYVKELGSETIKKYSLVERQNIYFCTKY
jgi:SAM-dependent methyltransferase